MIAVALRCFLFIGMMFWYTNGIWNLINDYFQQQFKAYLKDEMKVSNRKLSSETVPTLSSSSYSSTVLDRFATESAKLKAEKHDDEKPPAGGGTAGVGGESIRPINGLSPSVHFDDEEKNEVNIMGRNFQSNEPERSLTCATDDNDANTCDMSKKTCWINN
ncbi:hypothetical protein DMENIID0001_052220 [Sergentomyia squamirostris]